MALRIVWDTNIFISVFLLHGRSTVLAKSLFNRKFTLFVSEPVLAEYFEVAVRPRFRSSHGEVRELLEKLSPWLHLVHPLQPLENLSLRDPSDLKFVECAVAGHARYLVTGDQDLLTLKEYRHIRIVSLRIFTHLFEQ